MSRSSRCVAPKATAGEVLDDKQQDQDDDDEPEHVHPAWCAGGRSAAGFHAGVAIGVGVAGLVSRVRVLLVPRRMRTQASVVLCVGFEVQVDVHCEPEAGGVRRHETPPSLSIFV